MTKLGTMIKAFDIYGNYFQLRIKDQTKFKSIIGGILSIITLGVLIFCFVVFGRDFYKRKNPRILIEDGFYEDDSIPIFNGTLYEEQYFILAFEKQLNYFSVPYTSSFKNSTMVREYLQPCDINFLVNSTLVSNLTEYRFLNFNYYCLKMNDYELFSSKTNKKKINIILRECKGINENDIKQNNLTCNKTQNESLVGGLLAYMHYYKIGFMPENFDQPFVKKFAEKLISTQLTYQTTVEFTANAINLKDDRGIIISDVKNTTNLRIVNADIRYDILSVKPTIPKMTINISLGDDYRTYNRTYSKFQDLLASIGGFMKLILTILYFFNLIVRTYLMDWYIIDNLFNHQFEQKITNKSLPMDQSNISTKSKIKYII